MSSRYAHRSHFSEAVFRCEVCGKTNHMALDGKDWTEIKVEQIGAGSNRYVCLCPDHALNFLNHLEIYLAQQRHNV